MVYLSIGDFVRRFKAQTVKSKDAGWGRQPEESVWRLLYRPDRAKAILNGPRSVMVALQDLGVRCRTRACQSEEKTDLQCPNRRTGPPKSFFKKSRSHACVSDFLRK